VNLFTLYKGNSPGLSYRCLWHGGLLNVAVLTEVSWMKFCLVSLLHDVWFIYVSSGVECSESGLLKYFTEYMRYLIFFFFFFFLVIIIGV